MKCVICGKPAIWQRMKTKEGPEALCDPCLSGQEDAVELIDNYRYKEV